ncbi:hypothetical protein GC170_10335 [bacterium]|nr:hypothetical protein [bacterium]
MKESDQVKLSRYIDGDLSPLERKGVEAALDTDPVARRLASEYGLIRQFVKELPREPLDMDLTPAVQATISRKPWYVSIPAKSPAIAGIMAASVLIACFSVAGFVAMNGDSAVPGAPPGSLTDIETPSDNVTSIAPQSPVRMTDSTNAPLPETEKQAEGNAEPLPAQIAMAPLRSRSAGATAAASAESAPPVRIASIIRKSDPPELLKDQFDKFLKATSKIDRRHIIRLHVTTISDRQTVSILSIIGQYRAENSPVMERDVPKAEDNLASRAYVALIPTSQIHQFEEALRKLEEVDVERDKPDERIFRDVESSEDFRIIEKDIIDRAIASAKPIQPKSDEFQPGPHKKTEIEEPVGDAILKPLKVDPEAAAASGTLDQVLVLIRTDPLRVDGPQSKSSRKVPAKK